MKTFKELNEINVSKYVEKKGKFSYLSWCYAVAELQKEDENASWEIKRFDGLPYLKTEVGFFVEVEVTFNGKKRSQIHPVLDGYNKPIQSPNAYQINTSIQRCLVKAIALHGIGLYIYAGEDLPEHTQEIIEDEAYKAYCDEWIPKLEEAADKGIINLQSTFQLIENSKHKTMLWKENGEALKELAKKAKS